MFLLARDSEQGQPHVSTQDLALRVVSFCHPFFVWGRVDDALLLINVCESISNATSERNIARLSPHWISAETHAFRHFQRPLIGILSTSETSRVSNEV